MSIVRRDFLKAMGVAGAAAAAGCDYNSPVPIPAPLNFLEDPYVPYEQVLPYVVQNEQLIPGVPAFIATRCDECPAGCGAVAKIREGRVIIVEGNDADPMSGGNLCAKGVAGIQATYSPDRYKGPLKAGAETTWDDAITAVAGAVKANPGGVAWLGRYRSGSLAAVISQAMSAAGGRVVMWEPLGPDALRAAVKTVFGRADLPSWHFDDAHTIVSFGADFTASWLSPTEHSLGWANSRDPQHGGFVSRTVFIAPRLGSSGVLSDLHLSPVVGTEVDVALALASMVAKKKGYKGPALGALSKADPSTAAAASGVSLTRLEELAGWLAQQPSIILPGGPTDSTNPTALATAVLLLNEVCGNIGKTVRFGDEHLVSGLSNAAAAMALIDDCAAGKVKVLFVDDLDPVFNLPADVDVAGALAKVQTLVYLTNEPNDSVAAAAWVLPPGSNLESWGDGHVRTGHYTIQQQAMRPLYDTRPVGDIVLELAAAAGLVAKTAPSQSADVVGSEAAASADAPSSDNAAADSAAAPMLASAAPMPGLDAPEFSAYVKAWWQAVVWPAAGSPADFESWWIQTLQSGGFFKAVPAESASVLTQAAPKAALQTPASVAGNGSLTLLVFPHPFLHDGRHANKPWAQEVPEPVTSWSWTTWAEIHPDTAAKLGLTDEDRVNVKAGGTELEVDWFPSKGIQPDAVAVVLGNGKAAAGRYSRYGANPMKLLSTSMDEGGAMRFVTTKASLARSGGEPQSVPALGSLDQQGRHINYIVSKADLGSGSGPGSIVPMHHPPVDQRLIDAGLHDMYPEPEHPTYRFAMSVDLNRCTGCGACMTACHAENNIPVVGPDQLRRSRYMGWIRLSRYWEGEGENPDVRFQPVMCQQCSHAPCEGVCPVLATYHNLDGLNAMIYNRCVGTRYCANNCPYSARRFNFHSYRWPETFNLMLNPDVSTRDMGVMEKCTFCVQRIRAVKDQYRDQGFNVKVPSDALGQLTACAKACPSDALLFGNAKDPDGEVAKKFAEPRAYTMLGELNTKPGVRYLARINHIPSVAHHGGHGEDQEADSHEPSTGEASGSSAEHH